tara:strand:- start:3229 stop:3372 length:144 start_codon:yes stop_codon:yes gene_type:complete
MVCSKVRSMGSLPHRQLRKCQGFSFAGKQGSLPHRQLRNIIIIITFA